MPHLTGRGLRERPGRARRAAVRWPAGRPGRRRRGRPRRPTPSVSTAARRDGSRPKAVGVAEQGGRAWVRGGARVRRAASAPIKKNGRARGRCPSLPLQALWLHLRRAELAPTSLRFRFPPDVIALAVRCYLRYRLSYADLVEWLAERGVQVDRWTAYGGCGASCRSTGRRPGRTVGRSGRLAGRRDLLRSGAAGSILTARSTNRARSSTSMSAPTAPRRPRRVLRRAVASTGISHSA